MNYILFLLVCVYGVVHSHMCVCTHVCLCTCAFLHVVSRRQFWMLFHRSWLSVFWHRVQFSSPGWLVTLGNLPIAISSVPITGVCWHFNMESGLNSEPYPCTAKFCHLSHLLGPVRLLISYFEDLVFLCACYFWLHASIFPYFSITSFQPLIQMKKKTRGDILPHEGLHLWPWLCPDITVQIPCRPQFPHGN